jgi:hypothetical protein
MKHHREIQPLPDIATEIEKKDYLARLKQSYGVRKALSEIKHSIDDINTKIDLRHVDPEYK